MRVLRLFCPCGRPLADVTRPQFGGTYVREYDPTETIELTPKPGASAERFEHVGQVREVGITWTLRCSCRVRGRARTQTLTGTRLERLWDDNHGSNSRRVDIHLE